MNKSKAAILFIIFGYVTSCATTNKEDLAFSESKNVLIKEPEYQFSAESLTDKQLEVFELRAIQKLEDFYDYVNIILDGEMDSTLKTHTANLAVSLFSTTSDSIEIPGLGKKQVLAIGEGSFISISDTTPMSLRYKVSRPVISSPLKKGLQNTYSGTISSQLLTMSAEKSKRVRINQQTPIVLKKVSKQFGNDKMEVWEVFLAGVKPS